MRGGQWRCRGKLLLLIGSMPARRKKEHWPKKSKRGALLVVVHTSPAPRGKGCVYLYMICPTLLRIVYTSSRRVLIFLFCVVFLGGETHPGELYCFTRTQAAGGSRGAGALRVSKTFLDRGLFGFPSRSGVGACCSRRSPTLFIPPARR